MSPTPGSDDPVTDLLHQGLGNEDPYAAALAFQMQRLVETPGAAVVVEGRYSGLFKLEHVSGAWLGDMMARLQVRYSEVQVVFADSRKFAEEWTYRFLAAALADSIGSDVAR